MTVMVDELIRWPNSKHRCFVAGSCHLTTDGEIEELHAFAARLRLRRDWFQNHPLAPHYDLTAGKRVRAVALGALFVPAKEQARARIARRAVARASHRGESPP